MTKRALQHYRFGKPFAWVNRHLRSRRSIIKKIRHLYQQHGLVDRGCSFCGAKKFTLIAEGDRYGFDLKKQFCETCGLIQTYPALSEKFHHEFYSHHYRPLYLNKKKVNYQSLIKEQSTKGNKYLDYFKNNGLREKLKELSIIEIGCSSGGTLNALNPHVKSTQGCDLDIEAIKYAKNTFNLNVETSTYPTNLPEGPKLFIMSHVLEHVYSPLNTLKKVRSLMHSNDYLFIAVPGINMVAKNSYKNDLRRYFHIAHVTDFTASTLTNMAEKSGFLKIAADEEINSLFKANNETAATTKSNQDSINNIQRIERTYRGHFPHL